MFMPAAETLRRPVAAEGSPGRYLWSAYTVMAVLLAAYLGSLIARPDASSTLVDGWMVCAFELVASGLCIARGLRGGDRKSTRLNSSHRCISYAVFCLKKK